MNTKICTSIKQSKKLIELGIPKDTADVCYHIYQCEDLTYEILLGVEPINDDIPAWSLSALLKLIPMPTLSTINYRFCCETSEFSSKYYDEPVDAAFEMVVWLKENGKI